MEHTGKRMMRAVLTAVLALGAAQTAWAGQWIQDTSQPAWTEGVSNWRYLQDDGTYTAGRWEWIDRGDGFSECYGFTADGWMYASAEIPKEQMPMAADDYTYADHYTVDENGRQCKNGFVILKSASAQPEQRSQLPAEEVTQKILALKAVYPEGMPWTNDNLYARRPWDLGGGCAAFAYIVQDAVFGADAEHIQDPVFNWDNIHVGDQIRYVTRKGVYHSVVVLRKNADSLELAEGNYSRRIHWGRILSRSELEGSFIYRESCY